MHEDAQLITSLGGPAKVARMLGFEGANGTVRVANWQSRGIPWEIKFKHAEILSPKTIPALTPHGFVATEKQAA